MTNKTYNGWTNYETWLTNLWIDQDSYATETISNICLGLMGSWEDKDDIDWRLGDSIKDIIEEWVDSAEIANGFILDMLRGAISEVNFREIAGHYYDELKEFTESDDDDYDEYGVNTKNSFNTKTEATQ
jgi:hypothetical protein